MPRNQVSHKSRPKVMAVKRMPSAAFNDARTASSLLTRPTRRAMRPAMGEVRRIIGVAQKRAVGKFFSFQFGQISRRLTVLHLWPGIGAEVAVFGGNG